jgi:propionyl-CoA synthetase
MRSLGTLAILECAVVGVPDELKGELPLAFVVPSAEHSTDDIQKELVRMVRETIGAVAVFKRVVVVGRLPKTRSGKILRAQLRQICTEDTEVTVPSTIESPAVLDEVQAAWQQLQQ